MAVKAPVDALRLSGTVIRLTRFLERRLDETIGSELSLTDVTVLGAIDRGIDLASSIARALQIDAPRVTRIVERLVMLGYVKRGSDLTDRRRCPLSVTPRGVQSLAQARDMLAAGMTSVIDELPTGQQEMLVESLERIRQVLDR